jgi:hypothetical protein
MLIGISRKKYVIKFLEDGSSPQQGTHNTSVILNLKAIPLKSVFHTSMV